MKKIITILLTILFAQAQGQNIDFSQKDNLLTVRHDTTFTKAGGQLFTGVIERKSTDDIQFSYYKNGIHLIDSIYYSPGIKKAVLRFRNSTLTDRFVFDHNGTKFLEEIYLDSAGTAKESLRWHPNGQLWKIEMFYNGKKSGKWYEWFENGKLLFEGEFKNGEKYGTWKYYNGTTGEIWKQEEY